jgi:hypothetical protein
MYNLQLEVQAKKRVKTGTDRVTDNLFKHIRMGSIIIDGCRYSVLSVSQFL